MSIDFPALTAAFGVHELEWRVGAMTQDKNRGIALAYVDARVVQDRLDQVMGPLNWQCRYPHVGDKTVCEIGLRNTKAYPSDTPEEWLWKADGAGDSDIEAAKGALSDAFKRAAVRWGIGRYLYDLPTPWVELENKRIPDRELSKLRAATFQRKPETPAPRPPDRPANTPTGQPANSDPAPQDLPGADVKAVDRDLARFAYKRIAIALSAAASERVIEDVLRLQQPDLELIRRVQGDAHAKLIKIAEARRASLKENSTMDRS